MSGRSVGIAVLTVVAVFRPFRPQQCQGSDRGAVRGARPS